MKTPTSLADISRNYLKKLFPTHAQRSYYLKNIYKDDLVEAYKELNTALTLFSLKYYELHQILFDSYIHSISRKRMSEKYNYSERTISYKRNEALEAFFLYIPTKYR